MPGMPERATHNYVRHGTSSLFAAFTIADGTVISELHRQHRAVEFRKFLTRITGEREGKASGEAEKSPPSGAAPNSPPDQPQPLPAKHPGGRFRAPKTASTDRPLCPWRPSPLPRSALVALAAAGAEGDHCPPRPRTARRRRRPAPRTAPHQPVGHRVRVQAVGQGQFGGVRLTVELATVEQVQVRVLGRPLLHAAGELLTDHPQRQR